jgi:hexaprenyl-diphosphate synthase
MSSSYVMIFRCLRPLTDTGRVQARDLVRRSSGVERTRELACTYADKALETLQYLPESEARSALEVLTERVVKRTW